MDIRDEIVKIRSDTLSQQNVVIRGFQYFESLLGPSNFKIHKYPFEKNFLMYTLNNKSIIYSITTLQTKREMALDPFKYFLPVILDLINMRLSIIKKSPIVNEYTYRYLLLKFYASNYDAVINYLKVYCNIINLNLKLLITKKNKVIEIKTAEQIFQLLAKYTPSFNGYLKKLLNQDLRNSISHETYKLDLNSPIQNIVYPSQGKSVSIPIAELFGYIVNLGYFYMTLYKAETSRDIIFLDNLLETYKLTLTKKNYLQYSETYHY